MIISMIAAIDELGGLGKDNQLLCHAPADLKHFKAVTLGKPIIMGSRTYHSIGKPLPGRLNIVLTHQKILIPGVVVASSLAEAFILAKDAPEVVIIGGATIYKQAIGQATRLYITKIHHVFAADVFFPTINLLDWVCESAVYKENDDDNIYPMTFYQYESLKKGLTRA